MDDVEKASIAKICKTIADKIKIRYNFFNSGGSFATPKRVKNYMKTLGYNAKRVLGYDLSKIRSMIRDEKPVFIGAFAILKEGAFKYRPEGHAWLIDGEKITSEVTYSGENKIPLITIKESLLHCNWGWSGEHDGYYESQVFDTINASARKDYEEGLDDETNNNDSSGTYFTTKTIYRFITY